MKQRRKIAIYWASSCGGCEIAFANLHEKLLVADEHFELVFCPCLVDTKVEDVERMADRGIAITLFNGAIRTDGNEEMAHLMRRKSELLIAYGACAMSGAIPALSNLHSRDNHFQAVYRENATIDNPAGAQPQASTAVPEGVLVLPRFHAAVKNLVQVVDVDYSIPGCPPESTQLWKILEALIAGTPLPAKGSVLGAGSSTCCDECKRERKKKTIQRFYRTFEIIPDTQKCLLEQGILCMGVVTRDGCGALCPQVNMPCIGCYGAPEGVDDQGAKMVAAIGSVLDIGEYKGMTEEQIRERTDAVIDTLPDLAGTFYKFSLGRTLPEGKAQ